MLIQQSNHNSAG